MLEFGSFVVMLISLVVSSLISKTKNNCFSSAKLAVI
nr:putative holin-like toxin [Lactobacillus gallinarum]